MTIIALLATAILFGGMVLFSFCFAAFLFSALPSDQARTTIRKAFPHFYTFVICAALVASALTWSLNAFSAVLLAVIAATTIPARQLLMPAINRATDHGDQSRFKWLHASSVLLTLVHIGLNGVALSRFV
jgi:Domain of unknown function (DUF4149)